MSTGAPQHKGDYDMATYVRELVDAMPPFTEEQRARLAAIFNSPNTTKGEKQ